MKRQFEDEQTAFRKGGQTMDNTIVLGNVIERKFL